MIMETTAMKSTLVAATRPMTVVCSGFCANEMLLEEEARLARFRLTEAEAEGVGEP